MNVKIIFEERALWREQLSDQGRVIASGQFGFLGKTFASQSAQQELVQQVHLRVKGLNEILTGLQGHGSLVIDSSDCLLAVVDRVRSFPIFYSIQDQTVTISNSARALQKELRLFSYDGQALLEFEMTGYVTGRDTLVPEIKQLMAGEFLFVDKLRQEIRVERYYDYQPRAVKQKDGEALFDEYHALNKEIFQGLIDSLAGRPAWIPLSGGLDSRWILTQLLHLGYKNIVTFSYGKPGHPEVERARKVARKLNVRWIPVIYKRQDIQKLYQSEDRKDYFKFADGLSSIPVLNDYYALLFLREQQQIPADAVIINGQSGDYLTGGHVPLATREERMPSVEELVGAIVEKHYSLWRHLKTKGNLELVAKRILRFLGISSESLLSQSDFAKYYEAWEWQERQAKFVVNGQRVYEWFGFDWRLPLWDDRLMNFWQDMPWEKKIQQNFQKQYLNQTNLFGVFNGYCMGPHPVKLWGTIATRLLLLYSRVMGANLNILEKKYLSYFMNNSPYYYQKSYQEYLKDSFLHRNQFSYLVKNYLNFKEYLAVSQ